VDRLSIYLNERIAAYLGILPEQVNLHMVHAVLQVNNCPKGQLGGRPGRVYLTRQQIAETRRDNDLFLAQFRREK